MSSFCPERAKSAIITEIKEAHGGTLPLHRRKNEDIKMPQTIENDHKAAAVKNKKPTSIYLMRHARPELPFGGRVYYGGTDYPLSEEGRAAASAVGRALVGKTDFDLIASSDMIRARETARLAVAEPSVIIPELREVFLGSWEGRSYDEVRSEFEELYEKRGKCFADTAPPGGESFRELQQRTVPAFDRLVSENEGKKRALFQSAP